MLLTGRDNSHWLNISVSTDYYNRLRHLATSIFHWINLPPSCNARFIENQLFYKGYVAFVNHPLFGVVNSGGGIMDYNAYDEPIRFQASNRVFTDTFDFDNFVLCRNNVDNIPTTFTVSLFADRLAECERTLDNNIRMQKTPYLIKCNDKNKLSLENIYQQLQNNKPAIFVDDKKDVDIEVFPTITPYTADKLLEYKHSVWAEALTFLGINNIAYEKNERLIEAEADANLEHVSASAKAMYDYRKLACKEVNKKFGLDIDVEFNIAVNRITGINDNVQMIDAAEEKEKILKIKEEEGE